MQKSSDDKTVYSKSQACARTGATPAQLKNWDKHGVLRVQRTGEGIANNRKLYTEEDIQRARDILVLQQLGLSLDEIQEILDAPEQNRAAVLEAYGERLRDRFHLLQQSIRLSIAAETLGLERLQDDANLFGSPRLLGDAYSKDQNLQQLIRWLKSHTDRDVQQFKAELAEVAEGFCRVEGQADWNETQIQIARFCDVWGSRLGWPTVGQMYELYATFIERNALINQLDEILGKGASATMARAFWLGWVSATLECFDDVMVCFYLASLDDDSAKPALNAAKIIVASACEVGGSAYLSECHNIPNWSDQAMQLVEAVFDILTDAALDEETEQFLELECFSAIDGSSLATFEAMSCAFVKGEFDRWYKRGGRNELLRRRSEWLDCFEEEWRADCPANAGTSNGTSANVENAGSLGAGRELEDDPEFTTWLKEQFAELLSDPPEVRWSTEDESCLREKHNRQLIEEASSN